MDAGRGRGIEESHTVKKLNRTPISVYIMFCRAKLIITIIHIITGGKCK